MFLGQYEHNIDEKGRLTIPVRYRELLKDGAYVTQGFDHNLMVLTAASFDQIYLHVNEMSITDPATRLLKNLIFSNADQVEVDKAGRILIPPFLRESIQLNGSTVIAGVGDYFEIWTPELWSLRRQKMQDTEITNQHFAALNLSIRLS
jgi:MraZ protein